MSADEYRAPSRDPKDPETPHPSRGTTALTVAFVAGILVFFYMVRDALIPFVFAGVISYVATPAIDWAAAKTRLPRWIFALITLLLVIGFIVLVGWLGVPSLAAQLTSMGGNLQGSIAAIVAEFIGKDTINLFGNPIDAQTIATYIISGLATLLGAHVFSIMAYTFAGMFGMILGFVLLGYMLFGGRATGESLFWLVPPSRRGFARRVWNKSSPILRRYFFGILLVVIYASTAAYIGLGLILDIHHAIFLALITGVLEIIPVVGPAASGTIAGLVAIQQAKEFLADHSIHHVRDRAAHLDRPVLRADRARKGRLSAPRIGDLLLPHRRNVVRGRRRAHGRTDGADDQGLPWRALP